MSTNVFVKGEMIIEVVQNEGRIKKTIFVEIVDKIDLVKCQELVGALEKGEFPDITEYFPGGWRIESYGGW